jgi:drug/metabolite transporter (DMT)-like permease
MHTTRLLCLASISLALLDCTLGFAPVHKVNRQQAQEALPRVHQNADSNKRQFHLQSTQEDLMDMASPSNFTDAPLVSDYIPSPKLAVPLDVSDPRFGRFLVIIAAAMYGTNFGLVKLLDSNMDLATSASLRFGLAGLAVTAGVWLQERMRASDEEVTLDESRDRLNSLLRGVEVGVWYAIGYFFQALGLSLVEAGKSAFFCALAVLVVPLLDQVFSKKPLRSTQWIATMSALVGVGLLELGSNMPQIAGVQSIVTMLQSTIHPDSLGDFYCLLQALFFGVGYWRLEHASQKYPQQAGRVTAGQLLAVAGGSWLYWGATNVNTLSSTTWSLPTMFNSLVSFCTGLDPWIWGAIAWTGLVSTALAIFLETLALQAVSAAELTLLMTTVSLWGSAFAYVALGEVLPPIAWVGGLLILGGCVLSTQSDKKEVE